MRTIAVTDRLLIREFAPDEQETYLSHFLDEDVARYIPKRTREERVNIFNLALANYEINGDLQIWGMFDKHDGAFIGSCLLRPYRHDHTKAEMGYSMEKKYWGKGMATEMAIAMVKLALENPENNGIVAVTVIDNIGSQRVLEKAGFKRGDNVVEDGEELAYFEYQRSN